ncbi:hypothetical protein TNCV_5120581 [Trichonephila clavipes]|nr:hypothetical protein TNCV_5120581 [Trichonephila clavipes]
MVGNVFVRRKVLLFSIEGNILALPQLFELSLPAKERCMERFENTEQADMYFTYESEDGNSRATQRLYREMLPRPPNIN